MKFAFVVERFPSLSETFVLGQMAWLMDRGHEVRVFATRRGTDTKVHPDVDRLRLVERTRYARPFSGGHHRRQVRLGAFLVGEVVRARLSPVALAGAVRRSGARALPVWTYPPGETRFDAIIAHFGPNGVHAAEMRRAGILEGPLATFFHGYDMNPRRPAVRRGYQGLFDAGDWFLPVSEYFRERLLRWGAPAARTKVHHMGVDPDEFRVVPRQLDDGPMRLLSVARLVEKKGLEYGIRAAAELGRAVHYTIVGDGPERPRLEGLIDALGARDRIELAGWQTQDAVAALLARAHLLLAPSVTSADGEEEGIPVALMEAMATGLPVVSTRHSGIPELIEDGVSGLLVAERDAPALTAALRRLREDPRLMERLCRGGRSTVERSFNSHILHPRLLELLHAAA